MAELIDPKMFTVGSGTIGHVTITDASLMPTKFHALGVDYKIQSFEDRPTIFGRPLRTAFRMTDHMRLGGDERAVERMAVESMMAKLKAEMTKSCPSCLGCPHSRTTLDYRDEYTHMERVYTVTAACDKSASAEIMIQCPDGQRAVRFGMKGMVPTNTSVSETYQQVEWSPEFLKTQESPPSFPSKNDEPYIRNDPDKPATASGDVAW